MKKIIFTMLMGIGMIFSVNGQALKVASNGNVGINQATPTQRLHLSDLPANSPGFAVEATGANFIKAAAGTTASAFFYQNNRFFAIVPGANLGTVTAAPINSLAVVGPSANVGIGTWSPTQKLDVVGNIKASGTITPSDRRLKDNITDWSYGLAEVLKMNPVSFRYNGKGGTVKGSEHVGLIAQDLQEIVPSFVEEFNHQEYKEGSLGEELTSRSVETYLEIKDSEIKYLLVNAIKEQQKLIDEKDAKIEELTGQINKIQDQVNSILENMNPNGSFGVNDGIIKSQVEIRGSDLADLSQNRPNPFNGATVIDYEIPSSAKNAILNFYNPNGQLVKTVNIEHTGSGQLTFKASEVPAGTYSYALVVDGINISTKQMILQR